MSRVGTLVQLSARAIRAYGVGGFARKASRRLRDGSTTFRSIVQQHNLPDIWQRYQQWIPANEPSAREIEWQRKVWRVLPYQPLISVLMPIYNPPVQVLREALDSVLAQTYGRFELCAANAGDDPACAALLLEYEQRDDRIHVTRLSENKGISENSNRCLDMATGEFVALMDHDDLLAPFALFAMAEALNANRDLDMLYSDEDKITSKGERFEPFMKPDWSPEFLHSGMYIGHLTIYRKSLVDALGGFRSQFDGSQDYDLALRVTEQTDRIYHVEQVLYHWRVIPSSASAGAKSYARHTNIAALADAMARRGFSGQAIINGHTNRYRFDLSPGNRATVIIPSEHLEAAMEYTRTLVSLTSDRNYEIVIAIPRAVGPAQTQSQIRERGICVRFVEVDAPFSFANACNAAAHIASGDHLIFLRRGLLPLSNDWIDACVEYLQQSDIGAVTPKLLYVDNTIRCAGLVTAVPGGVGYALHHWDRNAYLYVNIAASVRNIAAVPHDCFAIRRQVFLSVNGLDVDITQEAATTVDLSFRLRTLAFRVVYVPFAELKDASRRDGRPVSNSYFVSHVWNDYLTRDPYFTPNMRSLLYMD